MMHFGNGDKLNFSSYACLIFCTAVIAFVIAFYIEYQVNKAFFCIAGEFHCSFHASRPHPHRLGLWLAQS